VAVEVPFEADIALKVAVDSFVDGHFLKGQWLPTSFHKPILTA
jgi:hypothetical protein